MEVEINGKIEVNGEKVDVPVKISLETPSKKDWGCGIYFLTFASILLNIVLIFGGC